MWFWRPKMRLDGLTSLSDPLESLQCSPKPLAGWRERDMTATFAVAYINRRVSGGAVTIDIRD